MKPGDKSVFPSDDKIVVFEKGHEECAKKIIGGVNPGMTIRQAYKMILGMGFISGVAFRPGDFDEPTVDATLKELASISGRFADAMIAEDEEAVK